MSIENFYSANTVFNDAGDVPAGGAILGVHVALAPGQSYSGNFHSSGAVPAGKTYLTFKIDRGISGGIQLRATIPTSWWRCLICNSSAPLSPRAPPRAVMTRTLSATTERSRSRTCTTCPSRTSIRPTLSSTMPATWPRAAPSSACPTIPGRRGELLGNLLCLGRGPGGIALPDGQNRLGWHRDGIQRGEQHFRADDSVAPARSGEREPPERAPAHGHRACQAIPMSGRTESPRRSRRFLSESSGLFGAAGRRFDRNRSITDDFPDGDHSYTRPHPRPCAREPFHGPAK